MKGRIELNLLFMCGVAIVLIVLGTACGEQGPMSPTTSSPMVEPATPSGGSGGTTPTVSPPGPTPPPTGARCDIIQLQRAGVKVETHCEEGVRFYVPADPTMGKGYFNVWMPAVNDGKKYGPFDYYEWSKWLAMDPGRYDWALAAETKTEDGTVYQCDWHKREFTIPTCKVIPPECPAESYFDINVNAAIPPTDNKRVGCPESAAYTYEVSTNLPVVEMILPPGCTATSPTAGACQFPVEEDTYQVSISGSGKTFDGLLCGSDFENIIIEGCEDCVPCLPQTKVSLENDLVKDAQEDAYRIQTSFTMTPPGRYHLVVSQKTVLRDVTSDIQQAYLTPGNAEPPLACGSGPVDVLFEVLDDKCGVDVVCETAEDTVTMPPCDPCADSYLDHEVDTDNCSACVEIDSSDPGVFTLFDESGAQLYQQNFPSGETEICGNNLEGYYEYTVETECDDDEDSFEVDCEFTCEPPGGECIRWFGRKQCSDFGLVTLYKNDSGGGSDCAIAEMDAVGVIVKGGVFYHFIPNVSQGDEICTCHTNPLKDQDWSHVEYCGCPPE